MVNLRKKHFFPRSYYNTKQQQQILLEALRHKNATQLSAAGPFIVGEINQLTYKQLVVIDLREMYVRDPVVWEPGILGDDEIKLIYEVLRS